MELDSFADFSFNLGNGCPCGDAARKVWNVGGEVAFGTLNYDGISHMASLFQTGLLQDAVLRAGCEVIAWLARNSDPTGLARVLELAVTAAGCHQMPTIVLQQPEDFAHLHGRRIAGQLARDKFQRHRAVLVPYGVDSVLVPIAIRRVTVSPNPPYVNWPNRQLR